MSTGCERRPSYQATGVLQKRGWSAHLGTEGEVFCCPAPRQVPDDERGRIRTYSLPGAGEERHVRRLTGSEVHLLPAHERETRLANRVLWSGIVSGMTEAEEALGSERPRRSLAVVEDVAMQLEARRSLLRVLWLHPMAYRQIRR